MDTVRKQFNEIPPNQGGKIFILGYMLIVIMTDKIEQAVIGLGSSFT